MTGIMTLKEFDDYMQEAGFNYSLLVMVALDEANNEHKAGRDDYAYESQIDALDFAESEAANGPTYEPVLKYLSMRDERYLQRIYNTWKSYLSKIGRKIQEVHFDDK